MNVTFVTRQEQMGEIGNHLVTFLLCLFTLPVAHGQWCERVESSGWIADTVPCSRYIEDQLNLRQFSDL